MKNNLKKIQISIKNKNKNIFLIKTQSILKLTKLFLKLNLISKIKIINNKTLIKILFNTNFKIILFLSNNKKLYCKKLINNFYFFKNIYIYSTPQGFKNSQSTKSGGLLMIKIIV